MSTVQAEVDLHIRAYETGTGDLGSPYMAHVWRVLKTYASGTSANQQNLAWSDSRSAAAAEDTIDLAGALLPLVYSATSFVTFVKVTLIAIYNKSTTSTEVLTVGGGSTNFETWLNATGDALKVPPGGVLILTSPIDGFAVTATTGDILGINPGADTIAYDIIILGRSA